METENITIDQAEPQTDDLIGLIQDTGLNGALLCRLGGLDYTYYKRQLQRGKIAQPRRNQLAAAIIRHVWNVIGDAQEVETFRVVTPELEAAEKLLTRAILKLSEQDQI